MNHSKDSKKCFQKCKYILLNITVIKKEEMINNFFIIAKMIKKNFITSDLFITFITSEKKYTYMVNDDLMVVRVL